MARIGFGVSVSAIVLQVLSCGGAQAGAWTLEAGKGYVIADVAGLSARSRLGADRRPEGAPDFTKWEGRFLAEYGLTDRLTLRARAAYENWRQGEPFPDAGRGLAVGEAGGRFRFAQRGPFVGSLETSLRLVEAPGGDPALEYEARLLGGAGFELLARPAFLDAQLGYRLRPKGAADEALVDLSAGVRPAQRTLLLLQSFSTIAASAGAAGRPLYDRHKIQASVVFDLTERWSLQVGAGRTVAGSNTLDERSAFASVWLRF